MSNPEKEDCKHKWWNLSHISSTYGTIIVDWCVKCGSVREITEVLSEDSEDHKKQEVVMTPSYAIHHEFSIVVCVSMMASSIAICHRLIFSWYTGSILMLE